MTRPNRTRVAKDAMSRKVAELRRLGLDDYEVGKRLGLKRSRVAKLVLHARAIGEVIPSRVGKRRNNPEPQPVRDILETPSPTIIDDFGGKLSALNEAVTVLESRSPRACAQLRGLSRDVFRLVSEVRTYRAQAVALGDAA